MPRDMSMNAGNQKNVKLNLDALGDAANDTVNFGGNDKPILTQQVQAKIVGTDFYRRQEVLNNQNDPSKKYFKCILAVETEFEYEEDGQVKKAHCRDNYSGLRYIPKVDELGQIILDGNGEPILERLWLGEGSKFGRLFQAAQQYDSTIRSYSDFLQFMSSHEDCIVMTEKVRFGQNEYITEVIQEFI
jgi:hypothetical protein